MYRIAIFCLLLPGCSLFASPAERLNGLLNECAEDYNEAAAALKNTNKRDSQDIIWKVQQASLERSPDAMAAEYNIVAEALSLGGREGEDYYEDALDLVEDAGEDCYDALEEYSEALYDNEDACEAFFDVLDAPPAVRGWFGRLPLRVWELAAALDVNVAEFGAFFDDGGEKAILEYYRKQY